MFGVRKVPSPCLELRAVGKSKGRSLESLGGPGGEEAKDSQENEA